MDLQEEINLVLDLEATKDVWRNNHPSDEWKLANKVSFVVMQEGLSRHLNCGCLEDLFIMLKSLNKNQIQTKQKVMNGKFKLKEGTVLNSHGCDILTPDNCTDEKALKVLKINPLLIKKFVSFPDDWEELCEADVIEETLIDEEPNPRKEELEALEEGVLRIMADDISVSENVKKAHHKAGKDKLVDYILANEKVA